MHLTILAEAGSVPHLFHEVLTIDAGHFGSDEILAPHADLLRSVLAAAITASPSDVALIRLSYFLDGHKVYDETWGWGSSESAEESVVLSGNYRLVLLEHRECKHKKIDLTANLKS